MAYHLKRDDRVFGPFDSAKLKELAASGRLYGTDMISADGGAKWGYVAQAKGLVLKPIETPLPLPAPKPPIGSVSTTQIPEPPPCPPPIPRTDSRESLPQAEPTKSVSKHDKALSICVIVWLCSQVALFVSFCMVPQYSDSPILAITTLVAGLTLVVSYVLVMVFGVVGLGRSFGASGTLWIVLYVLGMLLPAVNMIVIAIALQSIRQTHEKAIWQSSRDRDFEKKMQYSENRLAELFQVLAASPDNHAVKNEVFQYLRQFPPLTSNAYQAALNVVQHANGTPAAKVLALEIGRLYLASNRRSGVPTIYDEQAINNDINVRCTN